jgi:hypothetical protein
LNLQYFLLISFSFILLISLENVYAVSSVEWKLLGGPVIPGSSIDIDSGNQFGTYPPVTLQITDSDLINGVPDNIDVLVTSTTGDSITLTLDDTASDGIFDSDFIIFMDKQNAKFSVDDTGTVIIEDPTYVNGIPNEILSSSGFSNGVWILSETDTGGILVDLVEDEDTGIFKQILSFCNIPLCSDSFSAKLEVTPGDIISIYDLQTNVIRNGIIIPTLPNKGALITAVGDTITASYGGNSSTIIMAPGPSPGRGGGGVLNPGLVLNFIAGLLGGGSNQPAPPTLGLDENQKRIVEDGFSFNGNPVDVLQYYTPYPLITTPVGQNNTIKLKIYEDRGPDNIAHVGLSYGLGKGETFNEGRATIEYDKTFDGIESVTLFDPKHVLGSINVTSTTTQCSTHNNAQCLEVTFDHIFREPLEYNMVATNIWDFERNSWQNYFNHGVQIVGKSMNPPEQYSGIYQGHTYHLTETGKNTAIDDDGNYWTFDRIWNRDYIKPVIVDSDILNQEKIEAIEQLGFQYSDGQEIFGFDRVDHRFSDTKNQQQTEAQTIMASLCPECQKKPFEKINDIFVYDMPNRYSKLDDPETVNQMHIEDQKAQEFLKEFFEKIYPDMVDD